MIVTMPETNYIEVEEKVKYIIYLRNKYMGIVNEEDVSEWEKYENEESEKKWEYYMTRSVEPIFQICKLIRDRISFYA